MFQAFLQNMFCIVLVCFGLFANALIFVTLVTTSASRGRNFLGNCVFFFFDLISFPFFYLKITFFGILLRKLYFHLYRLSIWLTDGSAPGLLSVFHGGEVLSDGAVE